LRNLAGVAAPACWDEIAAILSDRGDVDELIQWRYTGDRYAVDRLDRLQTNDYDLPFPRTVDPGDRFAARWLAETLANRGELDELQSWADAGGAGAQHELGYRAPEGSPDELWYLVDQGDKAAVWELCELLYYAGDRNGLWQLVRRGERSAHLPLALVLAARADVDELTALADLDDGDRYGGDADRGPFISAHGRLATLLLARGDLERLRQRVARGERDAELMLVRALHARRDVEMLRAEVHGGSEDAVEMLLLLTVGSPSWAGLYDLTADATPRVIALSGSCWSRR
jgi:hypothetical protein